MKLISLIASVCIALNSADAQVVTTLPLENCYRMARQNYPLVKQKALIVKSKEYSIENASRGYLPQFNINGQASYQSDVTEIPIKIPNVTIPVISKDQYKIYTEIDQTISDGGIIKLQKQSIEANAIIDDQKVEVELYNLKERINHLFFGVLLVNEQYTLLEIQKKDIQNGITTIKASIANGTALKSSGDALQAELLKINQQDIELKATRKAYLEMLSQFINQPLDETTLFEKPLQIAATQNITRPELLLFDNQVKLVSVQDKMLKARNQPRFGLFLQAGYGRPALNFLKNNFEGYYMGGLRINWSLSGLYTYKKDKALLENNRKSIAIQKETFLFNTANALRQQKEEINKLQDLVQSDDGIIALRNRIKNTAASQLEYGVINSSDYLREVNAEAAAKQSQLLHTIQLLMAQYDQQTTAGN